MIVIPNIEGQRFAVVGLGKSGLATAASLRASKAEPVLWDDNPKAREEAEKAGYRVGDPCQMDISGFQALVLSPGIPLTHPKPHPAVDIFHAAKIPVIGDVELLFRACPDATYVGITGTNGKSTTTALIAHVLKESGRAVQVGGNLGTPVLSFDMPGKDGVYVVELSSYQLDLMPRNLLKVAVLLNITPDHLDRHGGMDGYIAAKKRIVRMDAPQTFVLGTDEPETHALLDWARGLPNVQVEEISVRHPVTQGVMAAGQQMFAYANEEGRPIVAFPMLPTLPGTHNWQNACAAFATCSALGVPQADIVRGLKSFPGLAHRQQFIAEINGVKFINDSKATNADAAGKALACYKDIYWIIGGKPKEGGLSGLEEFAPRIRHAFVIGAATRDFMAWCGAHGVANSDCGTLDIATQKAAAMAWVDKKPGAVVLLSPACASFDQFRSFEERGEKFIEFVQSLSASHIREAKHV